jgi:hypothetical protein
VAERSTVAETADYRVLAAVLEMEQGRWTGHLMLIAGIGVLIWVLFRRQIKMRARGRAELREAAAQQRRWESQENSGAPLADAPPALARWQTGMFDLQRELKAELEGRIAVLQSLVQLADQRIATLNRLATGAAPRGGEPSPPGRRSASQEGSSQGPSASHLADRAAEVQRLATAGWSTSEIADRLQLSIGDVEFLQGML